MIALPLSFRPIVIRVEDPSRCCLSLAESAGTRAQALESLVAPDFSLPDLDGKLHSLSEQRGKKVLLIAYASW